MILWYGLVPLTGALFKRRRWNQFKIRFDQLRLSPVIDYRSYWQNEKNEEFMGGTFRIIGSFESVTDEQTLWIRDENLTVPVSLKKARIYLLPKQTENVSPEIPAAGDEILENIRSRKISTLDEGTRVFVGGCLECINERWSFASAKDKPLIVVFFSGPDDSLASRIIRAGQPAGEYWNAVTPYSIAIGAISLLFMASSFLYRPAFRLTVIVSLLALFVPLYPIIPPGLLLTVICRRLAWRSRALKACCDLVRLPMYGFAGEKTQVDNLLFALV